MQKTCDTCGHGRVSKWCPKCQLYSDWCDKAEEWLPIEILRPVTIASVAAEGPCMTEFIEFCRYFARFCPTQEIEADSIIQGCARSHPSWRPWLIEHGFIRKVEEREKIGVGSLWRKDVGGDVYELAHYGEKKVFLTCNGCYWRDPVKVRDIKNITDKEFEQIIGKNNFTRVHGHLEFVEDK